MVQKPTAEDLKQLVEKLEDDLKKLKGLLEGLADKPAAGLPPQPLPKEGEAETAQSKASEQPEPARIKDQAALAETGHPVLALEPEEFINKVEKLMHDAETTDRLTRMERQSRRLTGAIILALLLLAILIISNLSLPIKWFD